MALGLSQVSFGGEKPTGSIDDHKPGANIFPFGDCTKTGAPCVPDTPAPWSATTDVFLGMTPALSATAKLACTIGGGIAVADPGQHSVDIAKWSETYQQNSDDLAAEMTTLAEKLADGQPLTPEESLLHESLLGAAWGLATGGSSMMVGIARRLAERAGDALGTRYLRRLERGLGLMGFAPDVIGTLRELIQGNLKKATDNAAVAATGVAITTGCTAGVDAGTGGVAVLAEPVVLGGCSVVGGALAKPVVEGAKALVGLLK